MEYRELRMCCFSFPEVLSHSPKEQLRQGAARKSNFSIVSGNQLFWFRIRIKKKAPVFFKTNLSTNFTVLFYIYKEDMKYDPMFQCSKFNTVYLQRSKYTKFLAHWMICYLMSSLKSINSIAHINHLLFIYISYKISFYCFFN